MRTSTDVDSTVQVKIGIRNMVMPGARIVKIVVRKFTEPRMVPRPPIARPSSHRSAPALGVNTSLVKRRVGEPAEVRGTTGVRIQPQR